MALHTLTEDGTMGWRCVHCGTENSAHYSHPDVQICLLPEASQESRTVRLPACSTCGSIVYLKIDFSEAELRAPNMYIDWAAEQEARLQQLTGWCSQPGLPTDLRARLVSEQRQLHAIKQASGEQPSLQVARRHMALAKQLEASGKTLKSRPALTTEHLTVREKQAYVKALQEAGIAVDSLEAFGALLSGDQAGETLLRVRAFFTPMIAAFLEAVGRATLSQTDADARADSVGGAP